MSTIVYDHQFSGNELYGIIGLCIGLIVMYKLPLRFSRKLSILFFLCGITFGTLADHYIGTVPKSLYDTGNTSAFDIADVFVLLMYGPYSYLFFYIYDRFKIKIHLIPVYILFWSVTSVFFEWIGIRTGEFHYNDGYWLGISFIIYLLIHSIWVIFFYLMVYAEGKE